MTSSLHLVLRILVLVLVLLAGPGLVEGQSFAGKVVESIAYDPPAQPIDPHDLKRMLLVQIGRPLDPLQVAGTIDRLFSSGLYTNIKVDAEPSGSGVRLRFITESRR